MIEYKPMEARNFKVLSEPGTKSSLKDGDGDDSETFISSVTIETKDNGFLVSYSYDDETVMETVYVLNRDDQTMIGDLVDALGVKVRLQDGH